MYNSCKQTTMLRHQRTWRCAMVRGFPTPNQYPPASRNRYQTNRWCDAAIACPSRLSCANEPQPVDFDQPELLEILTTFLTQSTSRKILLKMTSNLNPSFLWRRRVCTSFFDNSLGPSYTYNINRRLALGASTSLGARYWPSELSEEYNNYY